MQKSLKESFRKLKNDIVVLKRASTNESIKDPLENLKQFVDVGVQTDESTCTPEPSIDGCGSFCNISLSGEQQLPAPLKSLSDSKALNKIGIVLPPNYSMVLLDGPGRTASSNTNNSNLSDLQYHHVIINGVTQERMNLVISYDSVEKEIDEKSEPCDDDLGPPIGAARMYRRSSSVGSENCPKKPKNFGSNKVNRRVSYHFSGKEAMDKKEKIVNTKKLREENETSQCSKTVLKGVLDAIYHQSKKTNSIVDELIETLAVAFKAPPDEFQKTLETVQIGTPPIFFLVIEKTAATYLKPRDSKSTVDSFVVYYLTSKPEDKQTTTVINEIPNPTWKDKVVMTLSDDANDDLVVEVWDKTKKSKTGDLTPVGTMKRFKDTVRTTVTNKEENRLIGSTMIPLKLCADQTEWVDLQKKDKTKAKRGKIQIRYSKRVGVEQEKGILEYRKLLEVIILHELNDRNSGDYTFVGDFSENSKEILRLHAQYWGLFETEIALYQWFVGVDIHLNHKLLSFAWFGQLLKSLKPALLEISKDVTSQFWSSVVILLPSTLQVIQKIRKIRHNEKTEFQNLTEVLTLLDDVLVLKTPKDLQLFPAQLYNWMDLKGTLTFDRLLRQTVKLGAQQWFDEIIANGDTDDSDEKKVTNFVQFVQVIQSDLQTAKEYYDPDFQRTVHFNYSQALFLTYDGLVCKLMETVVPRICKTFQNMNYDNCDLDNKLTLETRLFDLFLNLSKLLDSADRSVLGCEEKLKLDNFQLWFVDVVMSWLHMVVCKVKSQITNAVTLDHFLPEDEIVKNSPSAVDTLEIIMQIKILWQQLNWPDSEQSCTFLQKIVNDICDCIDYYLEKITEKLQDVLKDNLVTRQWCMVINNILFISDHLLAFEKDLSKVTDKQGTLKAVFKNAIETQQDQIRKLVEQKVEAMVTIFVRQLSKLADTVPLDPTLLNSLILLLKRSLDELHTSLTYNSKLMLDKLWTQMWVELQTLVTNGFKEGKSTSFFNSILHAVDLMIDDCYRNDDDHQQLPPVLVLILQQLQKYGASTPQLICRYYKQRMMEQDECFKALHGVLTVTCQFKGDDLIINVLSAKDLPPLNSDGKTCNVFVKATLLPYDIFSDLKKLQTKCQKKTTCAMFDDEDFIVHLIQEQKSAKDAIIVFKVTHTNHDMFSMPGHKQHIGDGIITFKQIEEWQTDVCKVKQHHLMLSKPRNEEDFECLKILGQRQSVDKMAKEFLKKRKLQSI